jgi:NAD(P)-dependent dehydrogenase (short-subunit alcohol dehydrogenase family)
MGENFSNQHFRYFYMAKAALKHLKKGGAIINTGSITGLEGSKELLDYSATKARFTLLQNRWRRIWSKKEFASTASRRDRLDAVEYSR